MLKSVKFLIRFQRHKLQMTAGNNDGESIGLGAFLYSFQAADGIAEIINNHCDTA